jgi:SCP-2 sterol transfer family
LARFLSPGWIAAFNDAVRDVALPPSRPDDGVVAGGGTYAWSQVVSGGAEGEIAVTLRVVDGHLAMEAGVAADTDVTIRIGWDDAHALALGTLAPAEAIASGRVRVRGDLAVLAAGQDVLTALAPRLAALHAVTTY